MLVYKKKILTKKLNEAFIIISQKIEKLTIPKEFSQFVLYAISELFANIQEHSKAKTASITVKIDKKNSLIEISDNGIGLRKSYILKKIYPKNDFSAIEFALSGLSTKDFQRRGFGFYTIRKFIESLEGEMNIKGGKALVNIRKNKMDFSLCPVKKGVKIILKTPVKNINFYKYIE